MRPFTDLLDGDDWLERLPSENDPSNVMVWCERCRCEHRKYTFTREDFERVMLQQAQEMAKAIDAQIAREVQNDASGQ